MKKKQLIEELDRKLGFANATVFKQMQEIARLNNKIEEVPSKFDSLNKMHEGQFKVAEAEIKRLKIIIHYLEEKTLKVYE